MEIVLGVLLAIAVIAVIFLLLQVGPARSASAQSQKEVESLKERLTQVEQESRKSSEALGSKRKEIEELKERVRDVKKRRQDEREAEKFQRDLQRAREEIELEMEKKLDRARDDAEEARHTVQRLSAEVEVLKSRRSSPPTSTVVVEGKPEARPEPRVREVRPEELARLDAAEKSVKELREKLTHQSTELQAQKGRSETDRRVYLIQKKEIELAKDKFRALELKHNALIHERDELGLRLFDLEKQMKGLAPTAPMASEPVAAPVLPEPMPVPEPTVETKQEA